MYAFEAQAIRKSYGGVRALKGVDLAVRPGTVHALLGENGAGKSTLVKIMTGATNPDSGTLRLDGRDVRFGSTLDASRDGVAIVSQELSLFPHLSVLANLFPMREPRRGPFVDRGEMRRRAAPVLDQLGVSVDPRTPVRELSLADRQLVEIAKALVSEPRVLLLDEPTSALESGASDRLLDILRVLRRREVAVVFVTHILEEVMSVSDEVTVLRDGDVVIGGEPIEGYTIPTLVSAMIGDRLVATPGTAVRAAAELSGEAGAGLRVEGVSLASGVRDVSFTARPGEVLGLAGLVGSGATETLRAVAGIERTTAGTITLPDGSVGRRGLRRNIQAGVAFVSGDRRRLGLMLAKPIWENIVQVRTMGLARDGLFLRRRTLVERATGLMRQLNVKAPDALAEVGSLSGGNQQKVVLAKWLDNAPSTILLDDPTRGVDVGARAEIHGLLRGTAAGGAAVVMCSTDLEELATACDRVVVFYRGRICAELGGDALDSPTLLRIMNTGEAA